MKINLKELKEKAKAALGYSDFETTRTARFTFQLAMDPVVIISVIEDLERAKEALRYVMAHTFDENYKPCADALSEMNTE